MRKAKYLVKLDELEIRKLQDMQIKGRHSAREQRRARVLLLAHEGKKNKEIVISTGLSEQAIIKIKKRFCEEGLELQDKPRSGQPSKIDKRTESYLMALACSPAPEGRDVWTMQLLADNLIEMQVVDSISDETVRRHLKKMNLSPGLRNSGV